MSSPLKWVGAVVGVVAGTADGARVGAADGAAGGARVGAADGARFKVVN